MYSRFFKTLLFVATSACLISSCSELKNLTDSTSSDDTDDLAQKHVEAEEWTAAIAAYDAEIAKKPDDATNWGWRAYCYEAANNHHKAIADATKALSLDPEAEWAYDTRASAYRALKMYKQSIADYTSEIKLKPDEADNYVGRADVYDDNKQFEAALADYAKALQIDRTSTLALNNRGWAYFETSQYDKALDDFDACLQEDEKYTNAYYNRAATNFRRGKESAALADLKHVIADDPSEYLAYLDRGAIYLIMKQPEKALAEFNQVGDRMADPAAASWGKIYAILTDKLLNKGDAARSALKSLLDESASNDWPYAITLYLSGKMTEKELLDLCSNDDERTDARGVIAMNEQISGNAAKAQPNFTWLKEHATPNNRGMFIAIAALKNPSFLSASKSK